MWHHILSSSQDYALVLEDDMRLAPDLAALARDTRWFPRGTQAVKLEKFKPGTSRVLLGPRIGATPSGRDIHPLWSRHCGAGAYVISRRGAELAAAQAGRMRVPIDHFLFNDTVSPIRAGLAPSIVVPPMATQVATEQGSDIATAHGLPPLRLAARELRRGLCEFGQVHRQLARLATGRARITPIAYSDIPQDGALMPPAPPQAAP